MILPCQLTKKACQFLSFFDAENMEALPTEILEIVFKLLSWKTIEDFRQGSTMCRRWKNIIEKMLKNKGIQAIFQIGKYVKVDFF